MSSHRKAEPQCTRITSMLTTRVAKAAIACPANLIRPKMNDLHLDQSGPVILKRLVSSQNSFDSLNSRLTTRMGRSGQQPDFAKQNYHDDPLGEQMHFRGTCRPVNLGNSLRGTCSRHTSPMQPIRDVLRWDLQTEMTHEHAP